MFSFLKDEAIKCRFSGPVARQPALPCYPPSMNFIGPPGTELLQFLAGYVT